MYALMVREEKVKKKLDLINDWLNIIAMFLIGKYWTKRLGQHHAQIALLDRDC